MRIPESKIILYIDYCRIIKINFNTVETAQVPIFVILLHQRQIIIIVRALGFLSYKHDYRLFLTLCSN